MMKTSIILFLAFILSTTPSCSSTETPSKQNEEEDQNLIYKDDFDTFRAYVWNKEVHNPGWVNSELQAYDTDHVNVGKDGDKSVLILTAERKGNRIYSGRVNSKGNKSFKYGTIEASIRLPKSNAGLWPAFWMMGDNDKEWPKCGEIDIMEMGEKSGMASGNSEKQVNTAIHFGESAATHKQEYDLKIFPNSLQDDKYHTYSMKWSGNEITISVDGVKLHTYDISPSTEKHQYFSDNFFMIFNLAVGGAFTGITDIDKITALKDGEKVNMYVDWIKITK